MNSYPKVTILLITYKRTDIAIRTINGIKKHMIYPSDKLDWHIADDGSGGDHVNRLMEAIGPYYISFTNSQRRGVGASMNLGMDSALERSDCILWMEDDWELCQSFDLRPCAELLQANIGIGMIRLGYVSTGLQAELISGANKLWWRLKKTNYQYTFAGHASLRSKEFCTVYGHYELGLAPGWTELDMCAKFNNTKGPDIAIPAEMSPYGVFAHIGSESYKDMVPVK